MSIERDPDVASTNEVRTRDNKAHEGEEDTW
jgi:hypothetical protein